MRLLLHTFAYSPFRRPLLLSIAKNRYHKIVKFKQRPRHKSEQDNTDTAAQQNTVDDPCPSRRRNSIQNSEFAKMISGIQPNWRQIGIAVGLILAIWILYSYNTSSSTIPVIKEADGGAGDAASAKGSGGEPHLLQGQKPKIPKVQVEVYYEVLCPDSRSFVIHQLSPTWEKLKSIMDVHLKPYGKAQHKKDGNNRNGFMFECQHGPTECLGNMIHSCASKYVNDQSILVSYITCMIQNNRDATGVGRTCAENLGVNWDEIEKCTNGPEGGDLLASHGEDTHSLRPRVSFIPTVQVDGSQDGQNLMLKNLVKVVCNAYKGEDKPQACL